LQTPCNPKALIITQLFFRRACIRSCRLEGEALRLRAQIGQSISLSKLAIAQMRLPMTATKNDMSIVDVRS